MFLYLNGIKLEIKIEVRQGISSNSYMTVIRFTILWLGKQGGGV